MTLVAKAERNSELAKPRHTWEYNIGIDPGEIGLEKLDCVHVSG
jgi:hypothetical protein